MNATLLNIIAASVVRSIAFPRKLAGRMTRGQSLNARMWVDLSEHDREDVRQSVALAILSAGLLDCKAFRAVDAAGAKSANAAALARRAATCDAPAALLALESAHEGEREVCKLAIRSVPFSVWRAAFIAARRTLRMGNRAGDSMLYANPLPIMGDGADAARLDLNGFCEPSPDLEARAIRRVRLARRARYLRECISAAHGVDLSRKRDAGRKGARRFLRWLAAYSAGHAFGALEFSGRAGDGRRDQALNDAKRRFVEYIARGESELTRRTMEGIPLCKVRVYRTLANLPAMVARE